LRAIGYICAVDTNVVWAAAFDPSNLANPVNEYTKTIDGGNNWERGVVTASDSLQLSMIYALDENLAYAALYVLQGDSGKIMKTTDGGDNWINIDSLEFTSNPKLIYFWNENDGLVIADPDSNYFQIFTTNDAGSTWEKVEKINMPVSQDGELTSSQSYSVVGDTFWFGGVTIGKIYVSHDRGKNWSFIGTPLDDVTKVIFKDSVNGIIGNVNLLTNSWKLFETKNGGLSWSNVDPLGIVDYYDICYVPGSADTYVSSGYGLSQSNDGGKTWMSFNPPSGGISPYYTNLAFVDPSTGWAGGVNFGDYTGGIYKYQGVPLSIVNISSNNLTFDLYPNPGNGVFQIKLNNCTATATVTVYNLLGERMFFLDHYTPVIDLNHLKPGVYIVMIRNDKDFIQKKLIIQ
ncbi:MAG: T9SS type A sorting domain-containing protein, partial [Bacteroidales bacterium]|nr:T9SS type A sorting domain-containing protein [Bacteroidales bacterium]